MNSIIFPIESYEASMHSFRRPNPTNQYPSNSLGTISCRGQKDGINCILTINFGSPPEEFPANQFFSASPTFKIGTQWLTLDYFSICIDILRNEKPVFAWINENDPINNRIFTGSEPVGEGEDLLTGN